MMRGFGLLVVVMLMVFAAIPLESAPLPTLADIAARVSASEHALVKACFRNGRAVGWHEGWREARSEQIPVDIKKLIADSERDCR